MPRAEQLFKARAILTSRGVVQSLAVHQGRVIAHCEVPAQKVHDLGDAVIVPGFVESHAHLELMATQSLGARLEHCQSEDHVLEELKGAKTYGGWQIGRGWNQHHWNPPELPSHHALTRAFPHTPVALTRVDGHAIWVNQRAMDMAGLHNQSNPKGGEIVRDPSGKPTGLLIDTAMGLVKPGRPSEQDIQTAIEERAIPEVLRNGITSFHDAWDGAAQVARYIKMSSERKLPFRLYLMLAGEDPRLLWDYYGRGPRHEHHRLSIRAIKLFADGALGSRGALMLDDYSDDPGNRGLELLGVKDMEEVCRWAMKTGFQVCTHAIGDGANRNALLAYERAGVRPAHRFRIEHTQIITPEDQARMARMGVIASVQPTHCTSDLPWMVDRLGQARASERAYPWKSLLNQGIPLALGSDAPIEGVSVLEGIRAATQRGGGDFTPRERLSMKEALHGFTAAGAFAEFAHRGTLEIGSGADLTVLSHNPLEVVDVSELKILGTIVGGRVEYLA